MSLSIESTNKKPLRPIRYLIAQWAAGGVFLSFLADAMIEKLWILSMLPWALWGLTGLVLFAMALRFAWRAAWPAPARFDVGLVPVVVAMLLFVGPSLSSIGSTLICCAHPTDAVLLKNFQTHRAEFEELRTMFAKDQRLGRVAPTFTRSASFFSGAPLPEGPDLSEARLKQYRELFRRTGLSAGIEGYDNKEYILFHASSRGLSVSGSSKGYSYMLSPPKLLVADLDSYRSQASGSFNAYRHVEENWYLYLAYDD